MSEGTSTERSDGAPADCGAPATRIAFRGRVKRRFLCDAHVATYTGSGKVATYRGASQFDPPADAAPGVFTGPVRRCGEESE